MKLKRLIGAASMAAVLGTTVWADEIKFANFTPPFHTINASVIEKMNEMLSGATGGEVTVRGYHGGELGAGPVEQYVRVVQGVADVAWGLPGYTSSQFDDTMIVELPNAIPLDAPGWAAIWAAYEDHLADEFPGTVPVALWTSEPNIFIMKDREVRSPADVAGLKIRVAGATAAKVVEALGGTPVQMPINQVYNSLQTGLIDGVITGSSTLNDFKLDEVANSYTLGANLGRLSFFAVMNQSAYDGLSDAAKAALDPAALSKSAEDAWNATSDDGLAKARATGDNTFIDLNADEAEAFAAAVADVVNAYVAEVDGAAALEAMRGAVN
ncbi:TRAP transporter substrate-binding protein [Actibacterium pelagium]|uniref:C4-dicarboxylate ABC transporter substrate-binding protein n=1 Tax=Actibacterium pelagium TaxID=2029103 RepID=A0A917AD90_9RHOB|nr:TRAP transporter substrate-binding protein [Actibacterium pelagium]GGE43039.1 C4-dicarboxylate ABC transporter substrate-binding protein [Actibacterium pelagium]